MNHPARFLISSATITSLIAFAWVVLSLIVAVTGLISVSYNPVTTDPSARELNYNDILIPSDEVVLKGWWIPSEKPVAELIFVHGAGSNRTSEFVGSLDFYRTIHELDVSIITMDLRNHGNSPQTDGILRMGSREWVDVIAAGNWLDTHKATGLPRIVLGVSMGGSAAIHALKKGLKADGLVLLDPQLDIFDSMMKTSSVETGIPADFFLLTVKAAIYFHKLPIGEYSPLTLASSLNLPILLIQDLNDPITDTVHAKLLATENLHVTLMQVPQISPGAKCLENKQGWGTHAAAHVCHPKWTKNTLRDFIAKLTPRVETSRAIFEKSEGSQIGNLSN